MLRSFASVRLAIPLAAVALAIASSALAWYWGPAEQGYPDSAFYLDGARHLARGDGYVSAYAEAWHDDYEPITHWAPGTSLMIALPVRLGVPPLTAAAFVLGGCYVAAVLLMFALGLQLAGRNVGPVLLALLWFALLPSTLVWLDAPLSDLPCALFVLVCVWLALRVMRSEEPSLGLRIAWGASMVWVDLLRYAGLLFVPGMLIAVALGMRTRKPLWARALSLWPSVLTCALGVSLWNLRNQRVAAKPLGGWTFVDSDPHQHLVRASRGAFIWVADAFNEAARFGAERPLGVLWSAAAVAFLVLAVLSARAAWREATLLLATGIGYFALIIAASSFTLLGNLNETRFWVAVWPMQFLLVPIVFSRARLRWAWIPKLVVVAGLVSLIALYVTRVARDLPTARQMRGLLHPAWAKATAALPDPSACRLYVNDPRPYMLNRQLPPTSPIPLTLAEFESAVKPRPQVCIAVSDATKRLRLSSSAERRRKAQMGVVDALLAQKRLEKVARKAGVTLYRLGSIVQ